MRAAAYLAIAIAFIAFGFLELITIGAPFMLTGLLMLSLWRHRSRSDVMVPALSWPWVFALGYVLFGPIGCTTTSVATTGEAVGPSFTRCSNVLGIDYSGIEPYSPPLWPALLAAVVLATAIALAVRWVLTHGTPSPSGANRAAP
ncbi:MAG TPA: hypothetical protein VK962_07580 [Actinomycetota bacterium]|nr:hypothetical protein [Actinomycetota bacterium]